MAEPPITTGYAPFAHPLLDVPCQTFYKIVGEIASSKYAPVVLLHGGPGAGHGDMLAYTRLWHEHGLALVLYDQVGCGQSTQLPHRDGDEELWRDGLFIAELNSLVAHLGLAAPGGRGYAVFGSSWGARLAASFAGERPPGLTRVVVSNGAANTRLWVEGLWRVRNALPDHLKRGMAEAEAAGDFTGPGYQDAMLEIFKRHLCRIDPFPEALAASLKKTFSKTNIVYATMQVLLISSSPSSSPSSLSNAPHRLPCQPLTFGRCVHRMGPSAWTLTGTLRDWDISHKLPNIQVPTLVISGEFDATCEESMQEYFDLIPRVRWVTIAGASHMIHREEGPRAERMFKLLGGFLTTPDTQVNHPTVN